MRYRDIAMAICLPIASVGLMQSAQATPFFEIVGGAAETQNFGGTQIIPNGARGFENSATAIGIYLRDSTAADGTMLRLRFDYIGTDAAFTNEFSAGSTGNGDEFTWCNKTTAGGGDCTTADADKLGAGNNNFFGNYAATRYVTSVVGELVFFQFAAELGGTVTTNPPHNPPHIFENGQTITQAHMGVFNIENGAFDTGTTGDADREGKVLAIGLVDGAVNPGDDDHQDFMVRLSVVPEPNIAFLFVTGLFGLSLARSRKR